MDVFLSILDNVRLEELYELCIKLMVMIIPKINTENILLI